MKDGTIDMIATDHAPHHYDEKEREFADAPNGIIGLETALAVSVTNLVRPGHIDFPTLVDKMSCAPARLFGLPGGSLARGAVADITVFDPHAEWRVEPAEFLSKGRNTPYAGMTLTGRATATIVGGRVVYSTIQSNTDARQSAHHRGNTHDQGEDECARCATNTDCERQQYEQWITALDSRREGTPEHVFERVKGDYGTRSNGWGVTFEVTPRSCSSAYRRCPHGCRGGEGRRHQA